MQAYAQSANAEISEQPPADEFGRQQQRQQVVGDERRSALEKS
jgi:hypothetical protein